MPDNERIDRLLESLARVSVQLETLRVSLSAVHQDLQDHEQRLRIVEQWKHKLAPILAALLFVAGAIVSAVVSP
ncbi:MAG: hypothetical protein DWH91_16300 [Planctomycetota bacterium]|nr:MAG: hypothetical protein DWH91_16300 [Planctomycetota bacterium]